MIPLVALTFTGALAAAFAWARFVEAVTRRAALAATAWDSVIVIGGSAIQLGAWAEARFDWRILLASCIASAVGTYLAVRFQR